VKSFCEINSRIREGRAVVVTASEMKRIVEAEGPRAAAERVDVVTTGTFAPMCSSGAVLNTGHPSPRIKMRSALLNGVPAYAGLAAVDLFLGATAIREDDPGNASFPGRFRYGGGHVIEDLLRGRDIELRATGHGTDCYPSREVRTMVSLESLVSATLLNPRNCYQNYGVAVNAHSPRPLYTYMGILAPGAANASYCSAGELSPLLNDPFYRTIGIGTRIFLGGTAGHVVFPGTQHSPCGPRSGLGIPLAGAGTLAVIGDLKRMSPEFVRGVSMTGYGASLAVGIGVPIPVLDEDMAFRTSIRDRDITAPVLDYSRDYPMGSGEPLGRVSYDELRSGEISLRGRRVRTVALSSLAAARRISEVLRDWISSGRFLLSEPIEPLPGPDSGMGTHPLEIRPPACERVRGL
jgi:uncharacterized protein (DUF39 family)